MKQNLNDHLPHDLMFMKIYNRRNQSTKTGGWLVGAHDSRWKSGLSRAREWQGGEVCLPFPKAIEDRVEMDLPGSSKRLANLGKMTGIWVKPPWMMIDGVSEPIKINSQGKEKTFVFEDICLRWHQSYMNLKEDCHMPRFPKSEFDRKEGDGTRETRQLILHCFPGPWPSDCLWWWGDIITNVRSYKPLIQMLGTVENVIQLKNG